MICDQMAYKLIDIMIFIFVCIKYTYKKKS